MVLVEVLSCARHGGGGGGRRGAGREQVAAGTGGLRAVCERALPRVVAPLHSNKAVHCSPARQMHLLNPACRDVNTCPNARHARARRKDT